MCVEAATLWRPDSESRERRSRSGPPTAKSRQLSWAAGKALAAWLAGLPVTDGASYQVEWPDSGEKSSLDFVAVPGTPGDIVGAAQVLISHGCQKQLDLLVGKRGKQGLAIS